MEVQYNRLVRRATFCVGSGSRVGELGESDLAPCCQKGDRSPKESQACHPQFSQGTLYVHPFVQVPGHYY